MSIHHDVVKRKKKRPARKQVDEKGNGGASGPAPPGVIWNIWYHKHSGGERQDPHNSEAPAEGRCNIERDSGYTRGDKVPGCYFCVFFARGLCSQGADCHYLHRLPTHTDVFSPNVDCFGRDKHADYKDDMTGVGSFMRQNTTLYVGKISVSDDIEEVIARHFAEWGEIERIRILNSRGIAFITYTLEASAQFAKEAMLRQPLDHNEIINIRWATHDPNPLAVARDQQRVEEQAAEAIRRALPAAFIDELEGRSSKKQKQEQRSLGLPGYEAPDDVWYARGEGAVRDQTNPTQRQLEGGADKQLVQKKVEIASSTTLDMLAKLRQNNTASPNAKGLLNVGDYDSD